MKVFVQPTGLHSIAMVRIANALERYLPSDFEVVAQPEDADLQILHVIGFDGLSQLKAKDYAVIQYCCYAERFDPRLQDLWRHAKAVWSYYPLEDAITAPHFLHAPLGLDDAFRPIERRQPCEFTLMTSGFTTGESAEAIEEAAWAVQRVNGKMLHLGPSVIEGMEHYPPCWISQRGMNDATLARLYRIAHRVSGLRHVEGFELPALEGLACGARPVLFDRPDMRLWYDGHAEFVPECHGEELTALLTDVLKADPTPVSLAEQQHVARVFDWGTIAPRFWEMFEAPTPVSVSTPRKRLLWVGDAVAATGFAKATHNICNELVQTYDVHILGINYYGDPHGYPYPIYPCYAGGDLLGFGRLPAIVASVQPDVIVLQNDPWNMPGYLKSVGQTPTIGSVAIDGKHPHGASLNGLSHAIFWTRFAEREAKLHGYTGTSEVVSLGVDLDLYKPQDRQAIRARMQMDRMFADRGLPPDTFVVGCVGRNQWRKRLDLIVEYFAEWIHSRDIKDACLWLHSGSTLGNAWDLDDLAMYYGVRDQVLMPVIPTNLTGFDEAKMSRCFAMFDVLFTATLGEGFWLPGFEAAACGTPIIAPDWSAVGELFDGAAMLVPCSSTAVHPSQTNTIGGVMDKRLAMVALDTMYRDKQIRAEYGQRALSRAREDRFRWGNIAASYEQVIERVLTAQHQIEMLSAV